MTVLLNECFYFLLSVLADSSLLKSVLECSPLKASSWKDHHPSDMEDEVAVGLSSEDEAEGLDAVPGVSHHSFSGPARELVATATAAPQPAQDEVVVKKRALKRVKQQVSALICGEDLPEGAQAREIAEVPYQIPSVSREAKVCPICQKAFKSHHRLMVHMGVHRGEKFPCDKCGKVLATRKMYRVHTKACVQGKKVACPDCGQEFSSKQGMKQHHKAKHGVEAPEPGVGYSCPFCQKVYRICKTWIEHKPYCVNNPDHKGPFFCRVPGCPSADHPFTRVRNLNLHMSNIHGWKEHHA